MNWHATLVALMVIVGVLSAFTLLFSAMEENWGIFFTAGVPLALAFALLVGVVS